MSLNSSSDQRRETDREPVPLSAIDFILTAPIAVGWAGEGGEEPRLGWWRSDLAAEFGGEDLFQRLLPNTWQWAVLQGVREAARRHDTTLRGKDHNPDRLLSLYNLGFEMDERMEERLQELKCSGVSPLDALPGLKEVLGEEWDETRFTAWVQGHASSEHTAAPVGRLIKSTPPSALARAVSQLVSALLPLGGEYPLPHFRRST